MILKNKNVIVKKMRNYLIVLTVTALGVTGLAMLSSNTSFAASSGESSNDGGGGTPGCYKYKRLHGMAAKSYYDDTCFGGVWWEYPVNGNNNIQISSYGSVKGGSLKGCVDVGAEKYYRLSLVKYNTHDNYSNPEDIRASKFSMRWNNGIPEQVGLWQVYRFTGEGGGTTYRSEGEDWGDIKRKFQIAKDRGATMSGNNWEDISMFCYSESWDGMKSSFDAWSWVNGTSTAGEGPDAKIVKEIVTTDEKVTVNFKHQLSYNKPEASSDSVFDPANTDWHVDVTEDGRRISGTSTSRFTLINSGPNRYSIWEDMPYMGESSYEIDMPEGTTSKTVCSKITYTPKIISWDEDRNVLKHYIMSWQTSDGTASSEACIVIKKEAPPAGGDFTSSSTVTIDPADHPNSDIRTLHTLTTDAALSGDKVEILLSTDEPITHVKFYHQIYWNGSTYPRSTDAANKITFDSVSNTNYKILDESGNATGATGNHKTSTDNANSGAKYATETVDVSLKKGETKTVCRKIAYDPQDVAYKTYSKNHGTNKNPDWWTHYYVSSTAGKGDSEACATITRPADPEKPGDDPGVVGPKSGANNGSDPMYAGETVNPSWQGTTEAYDTRRLMEWQAIIFQVPVTTRHQDNLVLGNIETGDQNKGTRKDNWQDPCTWFNSVKHTNYRSCQIVNKEPSSPDNESNGSGGQHKYIWSGGNTYDAGYKRKLSVGEFDERLRVSDYVGDKYCNSLGFQFQYYYGYKRSAHSDIEWYEDTANPRYWTVYDAACRAIAKKPSVAVWNGGVMAGNGSIVTSLANRYFDTALNTLASGSSDRSYGSWAEYLAVINGDVQNFSSGAALATGSGSSNLLDNSPLTIANRNGVSPSLIGSNTILYNRLQDYLFNKTEDKYGSTSSSALGLGSNQTSTRIITVNGKLTIDNNIELSNAPQDTIYTLPQVVIYARDGIDITSNVTRVDAWLVTDGTINTCTSFNEPNTEAHVTTGWARNVTCEKSLTVNGPIFAKNVILNRTYGADGFSNGDADLAGSSDTRAATGEVFNLSADTYLWAYAQSGRYGSSYSEAYSRELPPRY